MKILNMERKSGKTTILIHTAYATGMPIITYDSARAKQVYEQACKMGFDRIEVYSSAEWISNIRKLSIHKDKEHVLIDDGEQLIDIALENMFKVKVETVTLSIPMREVTKKEAVQNE